MSNKVIHYIKNQSIEKLTLILPTNDQWNKQENCFIVNVNFNLNTNDILQMHYNYRMNNYCHSRHDDDDSTDCRKYRSLVW